MTTFAVFLRGVNVGGITVRMAALADAIRELPVEGVATILASGNVVCRGAMTAAELRPAVELRLRETFGYDAWVVVLPVDRLREIVAAVPYPADDPQVHAYVTLVSDPQALAGLAEAATTAGAEHTVLGPDALAWPCPKGSTLDSALGKITAAPRVKSSTTTRNLRTLLKVLDAAG